MKSSFARLLAIACMITIIACNSETKEEPKAEPEKTTTSTPKEEPKKTEVSLGPDGAAIKTKDGNELKVDKTGGSAGTKDASIRISTKDTTKR